MYSLQGGVHPVPEIFYDEFSVVVEKAHICMHMHMHLRICICMYAYMLMHL
jgi:hypothetical protein